MHDIIQSLYEASDLPLTNEAVYEKLSELGYDLKQYTAIGQAKKRHNLFYRKVRWIQQSLREKHLLSRVGKNEWTVTSRRKVQLNSISAANCVLAMSTSLGVAIWGRSEVVGKQVIDEPVHLVLSSPPYPLKVARAYGNVGVDEYIDFICRVLEHWIARLAPGGSICLNVSNDIFEDKSPARSTYLEELTLALKKRFGLHLMDRMPWVTNKAPGPIAWASKTRYQLNVGFEFVLWFTNDPHRCFSNNQRVLQEHSEQHKKLIERGGHTKDTTNADGNYVKKKGAFSKPTEGRIPTNVLQYSNYCQSGRRVGNYAKSLGLPPHAAKFPTSLISFIVEFLTEPDQLVADVFGGTLTVGEVCEGLGRKWVCVETVWEYIRQSFPRFEHLGDSIYWNPRFLNQMRSHNQERLL